MKILSVCDFWLTSRQGFVYLKPHCATCYIFGKTQKIKPSSNTSHKEEFGGGFNIFKSVQVQALQATFNQTMVWLHLLKYLRWSKWTFYCYFNNIKITHQSIKLNFWQILLYISEKAMYFLYFDFHARRAVSQISLSFIAVHIVSSALIRN